MAPSRFTSILSVLLIAASVASAMKLTQENWEDTVDGMTVFVNFHASWCAHCKDLEPIWEKLEAHYRGHSVKLVVNVDCSGDDSHDLCNMEHVHSYPTLKYGDPMELQVYQGKRDYDSLMAFADKELKPVCSPLRIGYCDEEKKAEIHKYQKLTEEELEEAIQKKEYELYLLDDAFGDFVRTLQHERHEASEKLERGKQEIYKNEGLALMKEVAIMAGIISEEEAKEQEEFGEEEFGEEEFEEVEQQ